MEPSDHEKERIERLRRAMYSRKLEGQLGERPRRRLDDVRPAVGGDWVREEPELSGVIAAPRFLGVTRKILWWLLIASVVFFLGAVAFFAYYFTLGGGGSPASPGNIDISVTGPARVAGGEPAQLQIVVVNRNRIPLELADLVIKYPPGTRSPTDFATEFPSQRITLGTIEPGGQRQGTVSAVFAGTEGERADVVVELEYRVEGSSAIFTAASTYVIEFSSSPFSLSVQGNQETVSGQPVELIVSVASNASAPVRGALLSADLPFGFTMTSASPEPLAAASSATRVWNLGDFQPGERKTVTIRGALTGEQGDRRVFRLTAGTSDSGARVIDNALAASTYQMQIAEAFLGLSIAVNKEAGSNAAVAPGENVNVTINYQNNLRTEIQDAIIVARLSGIQIDGSTVVTNDGFYRSSDAAVLWDKSTTGGALGRLSPGARGSVSFTFQMPPSEEVASIQNPKLDISVNAAGKRLSESNVPQNLQSAAQRSIRLATDLQIAAQGLYYANPFGSSGPMPPKANAETTYAVVFTVTNTTNEITDAKMTAQLPPYVRYIGICSPRAECDPDTQKLVFNQSDGTVTWHIGTIDPRVGVGGAQPRQMAFAVGLTPSTSQIGQTPALLQDIVLTGYDAAAGANVTRRAPNITTNILGDPGFSPASATVVK